jgi:hydrogenase nickel incorporation protein HypA/HybF
MHEIAIMESTLEIAADRARQENATAIDVIRLRVGVLSGVVPEALEFAFETLKIGTLAERGKLEIERVPAMFTCSVCGRETEQDFMEYDCPKCGGMLALRGGGSDLELSQMEVTSNV